MDITGTDYIVCHRPTDRTAPDLLSGAVRERCLGGLESSDETMWIGLDIGGANLKASDGTRHSTTLPFPIWKHPDLLPQRLDELLAGWPGITGLAVTMTAELADCFATKADGVARIIEAVELVARGRPVQVWQTGGEFLSSAEAREFPRLVAAANWHALATWAGRMSGESSAVLIDIGSTTTDIIPLMQGVPATVGLTDVERLASGELVYAGVRRTPLCGVAPAVEFRGGTSPLAAEWFATSHDLFLLTAELPEDASNRETADGRPATRAYAHSRLAHLLCCDTEELTFAEAVAIARQLRHALRSRLIAALSNVVERLPGPSGTVLFSGEGEFLARDVWSALPGTAGAETISLTGALGPEHSTAACAYALSRLAAERVI